MQPPSVVTGFRIVGCTGLAVGLVLFGREAAPVYVT